jgi:hypothetical protein
LLLVLLFCLINKFLHKEDWKVYHIPFIFFITLIKICFELLLYLFILGVGVGVGVRVGVGVGVGVGVFMLLISFAFALLLSRIHNFVYNIWVRNEKREMFYTRYISCIITLLTCIMYLFII